MMLINNRTSYFYFKNLQQKVSVISSWENSLKKYLKFRFIFGNGNIGYCLRKTNCRISSQKNILLSSQDRTVVNAYEGLSF